MGEDWGGASQIGAGARSKWPEDLFAAVKIRHGICFLRSVLKTGVSMVLVI
jgi:hypothetical protein